MDRTQQTWLVEMTNISPIGQQRQTTPAGNAGEGLQATLEDVPEAALASQTDADRLSGEVSAFDTETGQIGQAGGLSTDDAQNQDLADIGGDGNLSPGTVDNPIGQSSGLDVTTLLRQPEGSLQFEGPEDDGGVIYRRRQDDVPGEHLAQGQLSPTSADVSAIEEQADDRQGMAAMAEVRTIFDLVMSKLPDLDTLRRNGKGLGGNLMLAIARDGSITFLTTMIRETLGRLAALKLEGRSENLKLGVSIGIVALTGLANIGAMARLEYAKKANRTTRLSHSFTLVMLGAAIAAAQKTTGLGSIAPLLIKASVYSASRDGINLFVRLASKPDNPPNGLAIAIEVVVYFINQFIVNKLQSTGISLSGTSDKALALNYGEIAAGLVTYALANGAGEAFQGFELPSLFAATNADSPVGGAAVRLEAKIHLPASLRRLLTEKFPTTDGFFGEITLSEFYDKILGPMTARQSLFVILYCFFGVISKAGSSRSLSPEGSRHAVDAVAALSIGLLCSLFLGTLATSPAPTPASPPGSV